ncbi:MAG: histidinol-phosphatase [Bacteroidales bacterium]|nr:histidinol-phosphatase [Bacteroidales bacterium]
MKRILTLFLMAFISAAAANAQFHYQDAKNPEILKHTNFREPCRREIVIPQVNGYNVYKADLHTHTIFSDGNVLPDYRVKEAWQDGLDIIAITEHLEYRPHEETLGEYMDHYMEGSGKKIKNNRIVSTPPDKDGIQVDLNYSYERAMKWAPDFGIVVIKGTEISRDGRTVGHYNALFTSDNNTIYDKDPVTAIRNAKNQGAIVMHNHPGWRKTSIDYTPTDKTVYDEGLIDGVEVMNEGEFYPGIIDRAIERNLFIAGCSDIHSSTGMEYTTEGNLRPMTLILAKDKSEESLREALKEGRTIAYGHNTICGREEHLNALFKASVVLEVVREKDAKGNTVFWLTNNSSIPYWISIKGGNPVYLGGHSGIIVKDMISNKALEIVPVNMFCSKGKHPVIVYEY